MHDYVYYNGNNRLAEEEDCVCRAIHLGLGLPYLTVDKLLTMNSEHCGCDRLSVHCYHHLLEDVFFLPVRYAKGETVSEIARKFPYNQVIIRIDGHLTCAVCGVIYDIWDCTDKPVDCYWIAK